MSKVNWMIRIVFVCVSICCLLYLIHVIPRKKYTNADFGIDTYISQTDINQIHYEEDILEQRDDIVGHYRIS